MKRVIEGMLVLLFLFVGAGCSENSGGESQENVSTSESTEEVQEVISFVKDVNEGTDRIWFSINNEDDNPTKTSAIQYAYKPSSNGEGVEIIDFDKIYEGATSGSNRLSLKDLDEVDDEELWDFTLKRAKKDFNEYKDARISTLEDKINSNEEDVEAYKSDESEHYRILDAGKTLEEVEEEIAEDKEQVEEEQSTDEYETSKVTVDGADIETDDSGNTVMEENIIFDGKPRNFNFIYPQPVEILSNHYVGYSTGNKKYSLLTRQTDNFKNIDFDNEDVENVEEE